MSDHATRPVIVFAPDLLLRQQLVEHFKSKDVAVRGAATRARFDVALGETPPAAIVLELDGAGIDGARLVAELKAAPGTATTPILGFCAHTKGDVIKAARAAGADKVVARGEVVVNAAKLIGALLAAG